MHSKKFFAIFSALLVGFSCSFLPCFINLAYADTSSTVTSDYYCAVYATPVLYDPVYSAEPVFIPSSNKLSLWSGQSVNNATIVFESNFYEPRTNAVTVYLMLGFSTDGNASVSIAGGRYGTLIYNTDDAVTTNKNVSDGVYARAVFDYGTHNSSVLLRLQIPSNTIHFKCNNLPLKFKTTGQACNLNSHGAWVVDPQNVDKFEEVLDILVDMEADLDTQTEILNVVSSRLNTISGNVQSIYNLLYDSLHDESSELSSESQTVAEQIMQREDSEQYWNDKNMENYQAIGLDNFTFSSGIVSGISLVGTIFTNLWNALGDYTVIFTFSLTLGVALVVIGRVSRTGGKKGGDDG